MVMSSELVTNAIRHGRATGPEDRIRVRLARLGDRVRVEVRDDGPGFEATACATPPEVGGLGLQLVDRMAGAWAAEREGSTVQESLQTLVTGLAVRYFKAVAGGT